MWRDTEQARNPLLGDGMGQRSGIGLGHNIQVPPCISVAISRIEYPTMWDIGSTP
jgi:hypothetical protein